MTPDLIGIRAAREALRVHHETMRLERTPGDKPGTDVWHLLFSLRRYCEAAGVDFEAELTNVRELEPEILERLVA